ANDYQDIILRGRRVDFDDVLGEPYLDCEQAASLLEYGLNVFNKHRDFKPKRMVIHKTSNFREAEIKGFNEVLDQAGIMCDLISLRKSAMRLVRYGTMDVPRGSM